MFAQIGYYICVPFAWLTRLFYIIPVFGGSDFYW